MIRVRIPARALGLKTLNTKNKMNRQKLENWYNQNYKKLLIIPLLMIIFSFGYLIYFYQLNGDFIYRDISLTGGTSATLIGDFDEEKLVLDLSDKLESLSTREIYDLITHERKALLIETKSDAETTKQVLENYLGYELDSENSSFEFTGSTLGENFYKQLLIAILIAFVFMSIVVFIIFRTFVPSMAVIISVFADILMTLVLADILQIKMSTAGIVAFLMLIGYSVDTDILLTTRILKRKEGSINQKIFGAFKTGITMTLTSITTMAVALIIVFSFSVVLAQIFTILLIGLGFDLINTWITNVSILKWYVEKK
jgi:preprotein translocase subunit SecF